MSAVERCPHGDLPVGTCACHKCRPDVVEAPIITELGFLIQGDATHLDEPVVDLGWAKEVAS